MDPLQGLCILVVAVDSGSASTIDDVLKTLPSGTGFGRVCALRGGSTAGLGSV